MKNNRFLTHVEAKKLIDNENVVILDVRTDDEYNEKHIPNSILLPLDFVRESVENIIKDKNQKVLVYCRSGVRSKKAVNIMLDLGYNEVYDFGGIIDWPFDVVI